MQINGLAAGPTMAASEPPEPPPRNPDRINASLHKLAESVSTPSTRNSTRPVPPPGSSLRLAVQNEPQTQKNKTSKKKRKKRNLIHLMFNLIGPHSFAC